MAVPLSEWLRLVEAEYLDGFIAGGGAAVKIVVAPEVDAVSETLARVAGIALEKGYLLAWVDAAQPAWERTRLMDSLGFAWLQTDPAAAAEWWLQRAPGPDTLVKIINIWAQENPNEAGTWLSKQPPGPQSDTARMTFARQVNDLDPESALAWADTVSDATIRESTIDHIWRNWSTRDAAAAAAWLGHVQWSTERTRRLTGGP